MIEGKEKTPVGTRIVRAGAAVLIAHLLFKLVSIVQFKAALHYLPAGIYDVVYVFAFEGCIFSLFLVGEEVIGPAFLPVFMRQKDLHGEKAAWRFADIVLTVQFLLLLVVLTVLMCFPGTVTRLMTAWSETASPDRYELGRKSVLWLAPALICLSLGSTTYMLLNGYKRFFLAAFGDAAWKLCVLLFLLVGMGWFGLGYRCLVFGLLAGSVAKLVTHLLGLLRELRFVRPRFDLSHPAFRRMLLLMLPLVCGIVFAKVRDIYNNVTVLSALEGEGLMQANSVGRKLLTMICWLVPYSLSIAMFPFFCEMVDRDDRDGFARVLSGSGRMLLSVFIPLALVGFVLARPITHVVFHGGEFGDSGVALASVSMACYILALPAFGLEYFLMQAFFAHRRMVAVTVAGIVFSALSILISYGGVRLIGAQGAVALAVIALGYTFSRTLKTVVLAGLLRRNVPFFPPREMVPFLARCLLAGLLSAGACALAGAVFVRYGSAAQTRPVLLMKLVVAGGAAIAGFVPAAVILRLREPFEMLRWALERIRRRTLS